MPTSKTTKRPLVDSEEETVTKKLLEDKEEDVTETKRSLVGKSTLKFLVPNHVAGKLIGKGGSELKNLQSLHNLSIKFSPNNEYYPGTSDRIVCVIGEMENVIEFGNYLISDLEIDKTSSKGELKLLISNEAAGSILGKGGAHIKTISEETKAKIYLDQKIENLTGERVLKVLGEDKQIASAYNLIMEQTEKIKEKISNSNLKYSQHEVPNNNGIFIQGKAEYKAQTPHKVKFFAQMEIPDDLVGVVLGKGGENALDIKKKTGGWLQFSKKEEYVEGTKNRQLTISANSAQELQNAYMMVDQRLPLN